MNHQFGYLYVFRVNHIIVFRFKYLVANFMVLLMFENRDKNYSCLDFFLGLSLDYQIKGLATVEYKVQPSRAS